jgi:hypothetical protein
VGEPLSDGLFFRTLESVDAETGTPKTVKSRLAVLPFPAMSGALYGTSSLSSGKALALRIVVEFCTRGPLIL